MSKHLVFLISILLVAGLAVLILVAPQTQFSVANSPNPTPSQPIKLLFTGDIMLDRLVRRQIENRQDPLYPFNLIATTTQAADLTIVNLEGPVSNRGTKQGSIYSFRFEPVGAMNALKFAGVDIANLANNHIWDYGADAAADTMTYLEGVGIEYIGFGRNYKDANTPVIKTVNNTKIAFLGYTEFYSKSAWATAAKFGLSEFDKNKIIQHIVEIKNTNQADVIVVSVHWGTEYQTHSSSQQQELAHALIDAGADLIVGHHPHVVQEVEQYKGGYIAYSLGNFIFDQDFSRATMEGLMVEAVIKDKKIAEFNKLPIKLTPTFQPYLSE